MAPTRLDKVFLGWRVLLGLLVNLTLVGLPLFAIGTLLAIVLYRSGYGLPGGIRSAPPSRSGCGGGSAGSCWWPSCWDWRR